MCTINFSIQASDTDGTIASGEGRYKLSSDATWINFPSAIPDILAAQTPDITVPGNYDLQIRVTDNDGGLSDWTDVVGFQIGDCTTPTTPVTLSFSTAPNTSLASYAGNLLISGLEGMDELVVSKTTPNGADGSTALSYAGVNVPSSTSFNNTQYGASVAIIASATDIDDGVSGTTITGTYTFVARLAGAVVASISFTLFSDNNANG